MNGTRSTRRAAGMALVMVVALIALLVLCVMGLSALVQVSGEVSLAGGQQARARQNALLGLSLGLATLQRHAGDDASVTAMAGVTGVSAGTVRTTRHWCGVWRPDGSFVTWLTSGALPVAEAALAPGVVSVGLVGVGSVGASYRDSEHVIAGRVPIPAPDGGATAALGGCAFLVLDEGVKVSAFSPPDRLAVAALAPQLTVGTAGSAQAKLQAALANYATRLPEVLSYEQLSVLPAPASPLVASTLQDNFHHVTLTAAAVSGGGLRTGVVNVNTTSRHVWCSLLETYNRAPGAEPIPGAAVPGIGEAVASELAAENSGKAGGGPFTSVAGLAGSALLGRHLPPAVTPAEFVGTLGALLTVRSDTFRVRAYGDAGNAVGGSFEATAWCEALVQRTPDAARDGSGRAFVITGFRWLGPEDL